jgi:hypothetical protein
VNNPHRNPKDAMTHPPVVCDMTEAPDTPEERLDEYARLFAAAYLGRSRTEVSVLWRFRADAGIEDWARDLADRENACCAFMHHAVTATDDEICWDATTIDDPSARAVLDVFFALPGNAAAATVDAMSQQLAVAGIPAVIRRREVEAPPQ